MRTHIPSCFYRDGTKKPRRWSILSLNKKSLTVEIFCGQLRSLPTTPPVKLLQALSPVVHGKAGHDQRHPNACFLHLETATYDIRASSRSSRSFRKPSWTSKPCGSWQIDNDKYMVIRCYCISAAGFKQRSAKAGEPTMVRIWSYEWCCCCCSLAAVCGNDSRRNTLQRNRSNQIRKQGFYMNARSKSRGSNRTPL